MQYFVAKNERQLGLCLRMLYDEKITSIVSVCENDKRKIEYHVSPTTDGETFKRLQDRYRILIS